MQSPFRHRQIGQQMLRMGLLLLVCMLTACSTKKNTAGSRFWHSFTARYNTYFNGHEAYKEGLEAQLKGNADNYTALLPVFAVGNEKTASIGTSNFETAITKCEKAIQLHSIKRRPTVSANKTRSEEMRQFLKREEFNPFLKKAWLLMGQAQFHKGDFLEAASTFSYITRHYAAEPAVVAEARAWMARSYAQMNWLFDAEDALSRLRRDSLSGDVADEYALSMADLLVRQHHLEEAVPYLQKAVKVAPTKVERARLHFLLAQVFKSLGNNDEAYRYAGKTLAMSPPHALALNARILQTEVISTQGQSKKMIGRLQGMARNLNNKDYLDQIYYALGNIHLASKDTLLAISAYEQGRVKATRSGIEKGVLLVRLGDLYWTKRRFDAAQSCYAEALPLLGKEHEAYAQTMRRSAVLDRLVPYTTAVHDNDSMLALVALPEPQRLAIIDKAIARERLRQRDSVATRRMEEARKRAAESGLPVDDDGREDVVSPITQTKEQAAMWYFYNAVSLQKGKQAFVREWGKRKNEDNWRRRNKTLLVSADDTAVATDTADVGTDVSGTDAETDSVRLDPLSREYYLAQLPFSEEAKATAHATIQDGLYNAGLIEKDDLNDYPLAAETLLRLEREYPAFAQREQLLYQLFLLYMRWGRPSDADRYRQRLVAEFPESRTTRTITHPNFDYNLTHGVQVEDSVYTATYEAFRRRDLSAMARGLQISEEEFPNGANRAKFLLIEALSQLGKGNDKAVAERLRTLVQQYPESDISEVAANLAKGIAAGRTVQGGFDVNGLWERRVEASKTATLSSKETPKFKGERNVRFLLLALFANDSIDENLLLYDWANFNFTRFTARSFDIAKQRTGRQVLFTIGGFRSYDEAHLYAQRLFAERGLVGRVRRARIVLISERNYELIGTAFTLDDYQKFYDRAFVPLKINPDLPLDEPDVPEQQYEDVPPQPELPVLPKAPAAKTDSVGKASETSPAPMPPAPAEEEERDGEIIIPLTPEQPTPTNPAEPKSEPKTEPAKPAEPKSEPKTEPAKPAEPKTEPKTEPAKPAEPKTEPAQPTPTEDEEGEWYPI